MLLYLLAILSCINSWCEENSNKENDTKQESSKEQNQTEHPGDAKNATASETDKKSNNETEKAKATKEKKPKIEIEVLEEPEICDMTTGVADKLLIHYVARFGKKRKEFDNTYKRKVPIKVHLGEGRVIKGLEQGLYDMCVGEKRRITIPSELGYGVKGVRGLIPPNVTLEYDVELISFKNKPLPEGPMTAEQRLERKKEQIREQRRKERAIKKELEKVYKQEKERKEEKILTNEGKARTDL
ncbi:putative FK506-binding protein 2 [Monocercomonoides exilis]|uniref:putative FK506-binding protein 2 n=1 Tax=Monocercomonoides exilis TaxID=2049356 RepID=UPI003559C23D|nr:putative FK506-binding protein 2 [Monocercomonoides exilis]|eukprot:MONOS_13028.1-p1 / transcript=MONOS_13028.1 / gene=MONOS_13028 / organism=Monocercomonoides_exilis_PA203 / gene_product=GJ22316 / transcript_product=GJ22316 / location=Mono_scaffold00768:17431-18363(-) / protein_length=241 / sequence_SO=supercontig / SO=protein_coding / is_pseudo=false